jgi:hypothetical protein
MYIKAFCLCLLILVFGIFIYLKIQTLGSDNSAFNRTTRYQLGKNELLRSMLSLHKDGDARTQYLIGSSPIDIEVAQPEGDKLPIDTVKSFADQVTSITGRPTKIYNVDGVPSNTLTDEQISTIIKTDHRKFNPGDPVLLVIYADDFTSSSGEVAKTVKEFAMVLSDAELKSLTAGYPEALPQYQESTMLHEFGHQLGLEHNQQTGCIMNTGIEDATAPASISYSYTPTSFCKFEENQINLIKSSLR